MHFCCFCCGRVCRFIWERWHELRSDATHRNSISFAMCPPALLMSIAEQGCSLVPLGTSSMESPVAEGRAANHMVCGKEAVNLWKRFKSREKTGGIELHLKNGEREPICVEMMSPFPTVPACSAKTSHPLVQKHSLKQRLLSGGMAKKNILTLGLAQVAGERLHLLMPTPRRVERGPLGTVCHHSLSPAILWPGQGPLAAFSVMVQHP